MSAANSKLIFKIFCLLAISVIFSNAGKIVIKTEDDRIVNGNNITIDQFPYIVQISERDPLPFINPTGLLCGGTVISDRHIISAAHCFYGRDAYQLVVTANATFLKGDVGAIKRDIEAIYSHPRYELKPLQDYDVAVLKLKEPLPVGIPGIKVAEMCAKPWKNKERVRISGWGQIMEDGDISDHLRTVNLKTIGKKRCTKMILQQLPDTMACTIVTKRRDGCHGDSGGPAFYNGQLCGIISAGVGCGRKKKPALYTSIPTVRDFIDSSMLK